MIFAELWEFICVVIYVCYLKCATNRPDILHVCQCIFVQKSTTGAKHKKQIW